MKKKTLLLLNVFALALVLFFPVSTDAKVKINKKAITMTIGQTTKLKIKGTNKKVKWKSKKKSIVSINKKGKLTAKKAGKTTIIATIGSKKYKCKVTVNNPTPSTMPVYPDKPTAPSAPTTPNIPSTPELGTRENPINLSNGYTFIFSTLSKNQCKVRLQLLETIENADQIVYKENLYNELSDGTNRWILYHYKLDYLSGSEELCAYDIISTYYFYNNASTVALGSQLEIATFSHDRKGLGVYDVRLYPGGKSDVWLGILVDKNIPYTTFKIPWYDSDDNSHELWFRNL